MERDEISKCHPDFLFLDFLSLEERGDLLKVFKGRIIYKFSTFVSEIIKILKEANLKN